MHRSNCGAASQACPVLFFPSFVQLAAHRDSLRSLVNPLAWTAAHTDGSAALYFTKIENHPP